MAQATLFTPLRVGHLELRNRIVIAPMCQYSADEGRATDWHVIHFGHLALSGAALLTIEATAVAPEGRIRARDLGLWSDDTEAALARVARERAPLVRHADRHPARACGAQGVDTRAVGGRRPDPAERAGRMADGRAVGAAVPSRPSIRPSRSIAQGSRDPRRVRRGGARAARLGLDAVQLTARTATCCTSSCRRCRTGATTSTAAASKTGCAFRSRCSTRCARRSRPERPVSDAGLGNGLGARRLGHRADDRVREGARGARLRRASTCRAAA